MMRTLEHRYPAFLLDRLSASSRAFLRGAAAAVAGSAAARDSSSRKPRARLDRSHLRAYRRTVELLLAVSTAQRVQIRDSLLLRHGGGLLVGSGEQLGGGGGGGGGDGALAGPGEGETPRAPAPPLLPSESLVSGTALPPANGGDDDDEQQQQHQQQQQQRDIERALCVLSERRAAAGRPSGKKAAAAAPPPLAAAAPPAAAPPAAAAAPGPFAALARLRTQPPPPTQPQQQQQPQPQPQPPTPTSQPLPMPLLRVDTPRLLFQEDAEAGLQDKVRWFSFVYAAEQLLDEFDALADAVDAVLEGLVERGGGGGGGGGGGDRAGRDGARAIH